MSDPQDPGHPIGPEVDDSPNPTAATPADAAGETSHAEAAPAEATHADSGRANDMLRQLQQMIDQLSAQAGPPMREIAAKAAELAAVAAQRAGPLAVKAAEKTQVYGERFATKSKEMAADLRSKQQGAPEAAGTESERDMREPENAG